MRFFFFLATPRLLLCLLFCLLLCGIAQAADVLSITIDEKGVYSTAGRQNTNSNSVKSISSHELIARSDVIPAKLGTSFGVTFIPVGIPKGEQTELQIRMVHPPTGKPGQTATEHIWSAYPAIGQPTYTGWTFDKTWEITTGTWLLELRQNGKILARTTFDVRPPEQVTLTYEADAAVADLRIKLQQKD